SLQEFERAIGRAVVEEDEAVDEVPVMAEEEFDQPHLIPADGIKMDRHRSRCPDSRSNAERVVTGNVPADDPRRVAGDKAMRRHRPGYHRAGADHRILADGELGEKHRTGPNDGA